MKIITILFFVLFTAIAAQDDYDEWLKEQQKGLEALAEEENNYLVSVTREFDNYKAEQERLFQNFKDEVEKKWDEFKFSSSKTYVDYDSDLNARGSVDFENGVVEVEVIVDDNPKQTVAEKKKAGDEKLRQKLTQMVKKEADDKKPLLQDQLKNKSGKKVTSKNADSFAKEVVKQRTVKKEKFRSKDGKKRIKYTIKIQMQPDHVKIRAERFKKEVLNSRKGSISIRPLLLP